MTDPILSLANIRVVEFGSLGPGPHCAMLLADLGAEVLRIERGGGSEWPNPVVDRGRASLTIDIAAESGVIRALAILDAADVLIEGFRPGVMERNGLGPDVVLSRNPRLVYGRMTGWGQDGVLAQTAGHDINYIALTGALAAIGDPAAVPPPPLNLVGDYGGGSLYLALGIMAALWERQRSGLGQIVDAAIIDGVTSMMAVFSGVASDQLSLVRGKNMLSGSAPYYRCYRCADGRFIAVGAIEPKFYAAFVDRLGMMESLADGQQPENWASASAALEALFITRPRDAWCELFQGTDACVSPVLDLSEAADHPQMRGRGAYQLSDGQVHTAPAPCLSRSPGRISSAVDPELYLKRWGVI